LSGVWQSLIPWPDDAVPASARVRSRVSREEAVLILTWELEDPLGLVVVPAVAPTPGRRDGLWEATCFEAFVAREGSPGYLEFNVAPSGDWQCYAFSGYREGRIALAGVAPPAVRVVRGEHSILQEARFTSGFEPLGPEPWRVGLTAVIEDRGGSLTYWALAHTGPEPDFHRADAWSAGA
jgi:hypothetical protein